jgi:hypothetical protein
MPVCYCGSLVHATRPQSAKSVLCLQTFYCCNPGAPDAGRRNASIRFVSAPELTSPGSGAELPKAELPAADWRVAVPAGTVRTVWELPTVRAVPTGRTVAAPDATCCAGTAEAVAAHTTNAHATNMHIGNANRKHRIEGAEDRSICFIRSRTYSFPNVVRFENAIHLRMLFIREY